MAALDAPWGLSDVVVTGASQFVRKFVPGSIRRLAGRLEAFR